MAQEILAASQKTPDDWAVDIVDVIYKMHQAGIPYKDIVRVVTRIKKQVELVSYTEDWMEQFNPEGLEYIH